MATVFHHSTSNPKTDYQKIRCGQGWQTTLGTNIVTTTAQELCAELQTLADCVPSLNISLMCAGVVFTATNPLLAFRQASGSGPGARAARPPPASAVPGTCLRTAQRLLFAPEVRGYSPWTTEVPGNRTLDAAPSLGMQGQTGQKAHATSRHCEGSRK